MMTGADYATQVPSTASFTEAPPPVSSSPDLPADSGFVGTRQSRGTGPPCCVGCSRPILDQFIFQLQGHVWHAGCLRCSVCNILLSHACYSGNSQLYCQEDFFSLYGACCSSCTEHIAPTDLVRRAHDNVYHLDCFRCRVCQHQLRTGDTFYLCDGQLLCKVDYLACSVEEQCQGEDASSASAVSKYDASGGKLTPQNSSLTSDIVENIAMDARTESSEVQSWFRQKRTKTRHQESNHENLNETSSCLTSRVVAPPGGYPLPIVNRGATSPEQLPEGASQHCLSTQTPDLAQDRTHWTGWEDLWSNEFVPPNVNLEPQNINDGEVVGFLCQNPVPSISSQELQEHLYM